MKLTKVKSSDNEISKFLFILRNKSYVRKNSFNKKILIFKDHVKWFKNFLIKKNIIYLISENKFMIGYIRLKKKKNNFYVSWAVLKKYQKKGFAKKSLLIATKAKAYKYTALIKKNNLASINIAEKANFKLKYLRKNILYYSK